MAHVFVIYHTEHIEGDPVLLQECNPAHDLFVRRPLRPGQAIKVVELLGTIETHPHSETLRSKKLAPLFVEEGTVCLDAVLYTLPVTTMSALQLNNLSKVVEPQESGLASMPGEMYDLFIKSLDMLGNVRFEDLIGHAKGVTLSIEIFLVQVVTVATGEVAGWPGGLGENLEFTGNLHLWSPLCAGHEENDQ